MEMMGGGVSGQRADAALRASHGAPEPEPQPTPPPEPVLEPGSGGDRGRASTGAPAQGGEHRCAGTGSELPALRDEQGYITAVYPPPDPVATLAVGRYVYAQLKVGVGSQGWASAVVTTLTVEGAAAAAEVRVRECAPGRRGPAREHVVPLEQRNASSTRRSRKRSAASARLIAVPTDSRVVLVAETDDYRKLSRAFAAEAPDEFVVDIGSSFGEGTKLVASQCPNVLGVEFNETAIQTARQRHPTIRFERCDCLQEPERLRSLCGGARKIFIDINGNRIEAHVLKLLSFVLENLSPKDWRRVLETIPKDPKG